MKEKNKNDKIEEFLNNLRDKIKINNRTGEVYLPLSVIWAIKRKKNTMLEFEGLPWIFGVYTDNDYNSLYIEDMMQNTVLYGHMYWSNNNLTLNKKFNLENYIEHIVECPKCHQKYSDIFSNYSPRDYKLCTLCEYRGYEKCNKDKIQCNYEYGKELNCKECFFNGGNLDPRMSKEENEYHILQLENYYKQNS